MTDIFEQLLGGDTNNPQTNAAVVAQLRRQNMLGQMAQISGDKVLSPMGQQQQARALSSAEGVSDRRDRAGQRASEAEWRKSQQLNTDRQYKLSLDQMGQNEDFRRDSLAQTAYDRAAMRDVSLANAMEAANARKSASAQSGEKVARELRQDLNKNASVDSLITEGLDLLGGKDAPNTDVFSRGGRSLVQAMGGNTVGGESQAKLDSIGATLVQNMPKLGGSMSDADVKMFASAAGALNDPKVPNSSKSAALRTLQGVVARNTAYFEDELGRISGGPGSAELNNTFKNTLTGDPLNASMFKVTR